MCGGFWHESFLSRASEHARSAIRTDSDDATFFSSLSKFLVIERELVMKLYERDFDNASICYSFVLDTIIEKLLERRCNCIFGQNLPICAMAVGEFGLKDSFLHSGIKVVVIYENAANFKAHGDTILNKEHFSKIKSLNNKISIEYTTLNLLFEKLQNFTNYCTEALSARFLYGSQSLFNKFEKLFGKIYKKSKNNFSAFLLKFFDADKLRARKHCDTFLLKEPNAINGIGGFKEAQHLITIIPEFESVFNVCLSEHYEKLKQAYYFLKKLRNALLIVSSRDAEKLYVDRQKDIAVCMSYKSTDTLLKDFYANAAIVKEVGFLLRINFELFTCEYNDTDVKYFDGFYSQNGFIYPKNSKIFEKNPLRLLRAFKYFIQFDYKPAPELLALMSKAISPVNSQNREAFIKVFVDILSDCGNVYKYFKCQYFTKIFSSIFTEFSVALSKQVRSNIQIYTLGMHCIQSTRWLDHLFCNDISKKFKILQNILKKIKDHKLLYISLIFHDIGKVFSNENHSEKSYDIVKNMLALFGLNPKQEEIVLFLVKNHGLIKKIFEKNEFNCAAETLAKLIDDEEKLNYLYIHTFCDIAGTNELFWSDATNAMYAEVYAKTQEVIAAKPAACRDYNDVLLEKLSYIEKNPVWLASAKENISRTNFDNISTLSLEQIRYYLNCTINFNREQISYVDWKNYNAFGMSALGVVTLKEDSLIRKVSKCLVSLDISLSSINAIRRIDGLVVLCIYFKNVLNKKCFTKYSNIIRDAIIKNEINTAEEDEIISYLKKYKKNNKSLFSIALSLDSKIGVIKLETSGNDRIGMLLEITKIIDEQDFEIIFADVKTENSIALNSFWLKPKIQSASIPKLRLALDAF